MFNKKLINELKQEIKDLRAKIYNIPDIEVCSECGTVKALSQFLKPTSLATRYGTTREDWYNKHCHSCNKAVSDRETAVDMAKADPDKVIKCMTKKK